MRNPLPVIEETKRKLENNFYCEYKYEISYFMLYNQISLFMQMHDKLDDVEYHKICASILLNIDTMPLPDPQTHKEELVLLQAKVIEHDLFMKYETLLRIDQRHPLNQKEFSKEELHNCKLSTFLDNMEDDTYLKKLDVMINSINIID